MIFELTTIYTDQDRLRSKKEKGGNEASSASCTRYIGCSCFGPCSSVVSAYKINFGKQTQIYLQRHLQTLHKHNINININMKNFATIAIFLLSASAGWAHTPKSTSSSIGNTTNSTTASSCQSSDSTCSIATSLPLQGGSTKVMTPDTNTDTNTADADGPILSAEVEEFQSALVETVTELVIFSDDKLFEEKYGFTLTSYLKSKREPSKSLRKSAKQLKKVSKDTGITRIVGGGTGIFSGIWVLEGLLQHRSQVGFLSSCRLGFRVWCRLGWNYNRFKHHQRSMGEIRIQENHETSRYPCRSRRGSCEDHFRL